MSSFIVTINLTLVAQRLSKSEERPFDEWDTAVWLRLYHNGERLFRQRDEWGVFGCREDPRCLLLSGEIKDLTDNNGVKLPFGND